MMVLQQILRAAAIIFLLGGVSAGCAVISLGGTKQIDPHAKRTKVQFESEQALATFQTEVDRRYKSNRDLSEGYFAIPFVISFREKKVMSRNGFYNRQIDWADVDGDGLISELEARVYAHSTKDQTARSMPTEH